VAGIKEYNIWCAAPKTRTREIMKQTNLILMPPRQNHQCGRRRLGEWLDYRGAQEQAAGWLELCYGNIYRRWLRIANISPGRDS